MNPDKEIDYVLYNNDCLHVMPIIADKSVDMILADLPYGTTACKWDTIIPFESLWKEYKRIIKDNCAIVLTASQPFTSALVMSNIKMFKYEWVWDKVIGVGFQIAKYRPMQRHENILIFSDGTPNYYPIKTLRDKPISGYATPSTVSPLAKNDKTMRTYNDKHPTSIIKFKKIKNGIHESQKPTELFEYLIKTYTNEGDTVLDNVMGSGTTGVACKRLNRKFIGIEKDPKYYQIAKDRIEGQLL